MQPPLLTCICQCMSFHLPLLKGHPPLKLYSTYCVKNHDSHDSVIFTFALMFVSSDFLNRLLVTV